MLIDSADLIRLFIGGVMFWIGVYLVSRNIGSGLGLEVTKKRPVLDFLKDSSILHMYLYLIYNSSAMGSKEHE